MDKPVALIVNAGGQSSRMGRPKALLPVPPHGHPLLRRIVERLGVLQPQPTIIVAPDQQLRRQVPLADDVIWLTDPYPQVGPLGGIATGLAAIEGWAILVACDMPLLNPALFQYLIELAGAVDPTGAAQWDAIVPVVNDYPEPLHALYHHRCLAAVTAKLAAGERRATAFLPAVRVRYVPAAELTRYDPDLSSFINVNTPAEWAQLCQRL